MIMWILFSILGFLIIVGLLFLLTLGVNELERKVQALEATVQKRYGTLPAKPIKRKSES